jgi:hypothetical protein
MGVTKRQLEQAWVDMGEKYAGLKEDYFALLYLAEKFEKPVEALTREVAFGNNDYGLDAFHIDREARNLYLYQFKWSENQGLFKESLERLAKKGIERIFGNPQQDAKANQFLVHLKTALDEGQAIIDKVYIHFVFNGDPEDAEQSAVLDSLREDLESKKHFIDTFFGRNVQLTVQYIGNKSSKLGDATRTRKTRQYRIPFQDSLAATSENGANLHVGFLQLMDLYRMYREMGSRFFNRNIRFGLSAEKSPNRALRQAFGRIVLQGQDPPSVFAFNHNGVALSAERVEFEDGYCRITEPRVLNGAQTITSLAKFIEDNQENPGLAENRPRLEAIRVLAKVITGTDGDFDDFIVKVTVCNNRQNPVEPWHLRASDRIQLELQDKFQKDGLYYERQEGAFEALSDSDLDDLDIEKSKAIQIKRLAQTFLASQGEIDRMSRLTDVFENDKNYEQTFLERYLTSDTRRIVLAYKIHFRLNRIVREIVEKGAQKYAFLHRARNLVWALLIQALLNDDKRDRYLENFGTGLVMEADYNELLRNLASTRARFLIGEAIADDRSKALLAEQNYGFLRTKAVFNRCMDVAWDKYKWKKLPL